MRKMILTDVAWALFTAFLGWIAFFATVAMAHEYPKMPIPVPEAPGQYQVTGHGFTTYNVTVLPNGWGSIRDNQTGTITTFDAKAGTWYNSNFESGVYK